MIEIQVSNSQQYLEKLDGFFNIISNFAMIKVWLN